MEFSENLDRFAKKMIIAVILQVLSGSIGFIFAILIRRSRFSLFINSIIIILAILGYIGYSKQKKNLITYHGYLTMIISLTVFIYQFFLQLVMNGDIIEFLLLLPFVLNIIIGSSSLLFLKKIDEENYEYSEPPYEAFVNNNENTHLPENFIRKKPCCICNDREPNFMIYDCGHKCLCGQCSSNLIKNKSKCPLCRKTIINIVKVYD